MSSFLADVTVTAATFAGLIVALLLALAGAAWLGYRYGLSKAQPVRGRVSTAVDFGHETVPLDPHEDVLKTVPILVPGQRESS